MTGSVGLLRRRRSDEAGTAIGAERRRDIRQTTVFQVAKLISGRFEELCILRDISPTGLRAEIYREVAAGERISIAFRTCHTVDGTVRWARDNSIGVEFDEEVSVALILSHSSFDDRCGRIRPPRIRLELDGQLRVGLQTLAVRSCDASQAGLKLQIDRELRLEQGCEIMLPGLKRKAVVRWQREGAVGLMFAEPLTYSDFVQWRLRLVERGTDGQN